MIWRSQHNNVLARDNDPGLAWWKAAIFLLIITLAMFGGVLFSSKPVVLSKAHTDLFDQFAYWRAFGFGQLRHGNLALWNPHVFSGAPFLGEFQSALLYPLNALFLILPLARAINVSIALHVCLLGLFMYLWASRRGLHPMACLVCAVMLMFSAPYFMHILAGHLPHLCTMTWAPLVLLAVDGLFKKRRLGWCLLGIGAITMQILSGYPQHLFYTAVAAGIYFVLCAMKSEDRLRPMLGFFAMYAGAMALGAVQLLPGIDVATQSVRSGGLSYQFASSFSFPVENLLTLLSPNIFGNDADVVYWGQYHLWETVCYVGVAGFVMAILGSVYGKKNVRRYCVTMTLLMLVLALGKHTPLFRFLYSYIPGFDMFRGSSKFIFQASLFMAMLAGIGFDHLVRTRRMPTKAVVSITAGSVVVAIAGLFLRYSTQAATSGQTWQQIMHYVYATGGSYLPKERYVNPDFITKAAAFTSNSLIFSAAVLLLLAVLLLALRKSPALISSVAFLAILEIFLFAKSSLMTFDLTSMQIPQIKHVLEKHDGDYRMLNLKDPNGAMLLDNGDIWGNDSVVMKRYAEFMTFTQGENPDEATQYVNFSRFSGLYKMLRCRFAFIPSGGRIGIIEENNIMPRLQLVQRYRVLNNRDDIFRRMQDPSFDPRQEVILETPPAIEPVISSRKGRVTLLGSSTDYLIVEAELPSPAILLITDAYSRGWRVRPLEQSSQKAYQVIPANYVLRAIPLEKGRHHIRIAYLPKSFQIGKWISLTALVAYLIMMGWGVPKARIRNVATPSIT